MEAALLSRIRLVYCPPTRYNVACLRRLAPKPREKVCSPPRAGRWSSMLGIANTACPSAKRALGTMPDLLATNLSVPAPPGLKPTRCARSDARLFRAFDRVTCLRPGRSRKGTLPFLSTRRTQTFRGPHARTRSDAEARRGHDPGAVRHGRDRRGGRTSRELADLEC